MDGREPAGETDELQVTRAVRSHKHACTVEMNPQHIVDAPMRASAFAWLGASALSTPIWIPSEPRFANPHSA